MSGGKRYRRLVVPGRFQPLHEGHLAALQEAWSLAEEVVVVVGSAQESYTLRNPLTAGERIEMIDIALSWRFGREYRRDFFVIPVSDIAMNKVWVQYLKMLLPRFDGVVSGNELVLMLFEDMGLAAHRVKLFKREKCRGTTIRELVVAGKSEWKECVPPPVVEYLERIGFEERIRRLAVGEG